MSNNNNKHLTIISNGTDGNEFSSRPDNGLTRRHVFTYTSIWGCVMCAMWHGRIWLKKKKTRAICCYSNNGVFLRVFFFFFGACFSRRSYGDDEIMGIAGEITFHRLFFSFFLEKEKREKSRTKHTCSCVVARTPLCKLFGSRMRGACLAQIRSFIIIILFFFFIVIIFAV